MISYVFKHSYVELRLVNVEIFIVKLLIRTLHTFPDLDLALQRP
jgi:hypothetical protein